MRAVTAKATPAAPLAMVCLDSWNGPTLGVQVNPTGGATFTVDYSFDDPNDLVSPVSLGTMFFDTSMCPAGAIGGAAGITFAIPTAPIWMRLRLLNGTGSVRATFTQLQSPMGGAVTSGPPPVVIAPVNSVAPLVTGTGNVGQTLSCSSGSWLNAPTSFGFQWQRGGTNIAGATASTYLLVTADALNTISCIVTATNSAGSASSGSNSISVAGVSAPTNTVLPVVSGTAAVGSTLSCTTGTWTGTPTGYTFQWQRNASNIGGATAANYTLVSADGGTSITCIVTATNANGSTPATSNAVAVPVPAPVNSVAPAISGTIAVGSTLTCSTGTWSGSPTYAYQWQQDGINIGGATASTYVAAVGDISHSIRCVVTASNSGGSASANSNAVSIPLPAPVNTVAPVASGTAAVGSTLSCTTGTWSYSPSGYAYQWQRNGTAISGATASTYLTVSADGGTNVACVVTATNASGSTPATSNAIAVAAPFTFPGTPYALYSLRKVGAGYAGNAINVRRQSDGTTQDIGFTSAGDLNIAAAQTFAAGSVLYITKWYDQSGNGRDVSTTNTSFQPSLFFASSTRAFVGLYGSELDAATPFPASGDLTIGVGGVLSGAGLSATPLSNFNGSTGWLMLVNGLSSSSNLKHFSFWNDSGGETPDNTTNLYTQLNRMQAVRASGALSLIVNNVAGGTATGQAGTTPSSQFFTVGNIPGGAYNFTGLMGEAYVYTSALTGPQLSSIDASEAAYFPDLGFGTPYNGTAAVQFAGTEAITLGNVLDYEYTQPWTAWGAIQVWGQRANVSGIIFSNVPNPSTGDFPGYELWLDGSGVLRVRIIHKIQTGVQYIGVAGTTNVIDGKKHMVVATYDGSGLAAGVKMYIDGVQDGTTVESDTLGGNSIVAPGQGMWLGNQNGEVFALLGTLSHFQIDNIVRTQPYIAAHSTPSSIPPADANTGVRFIFNEGSGTTVNDSSGNGHNGTLSSATLWMP